MSHQEAPLDYEPVEATEADLGRREQPSSQRRRHENSGRSRHHHSGNGSENNHSQSGSQRQRRHEGSEGTGRPRTSRRMPEEGDVEQQQAQRPIPRPAVSRYRRQGDTEARLRAQQQRQRQRERERQQREAERAEQQRLEEEEDDHSALARSASTESGFHNHTDQAEGDAVMALEAEPDDEGMYGLALRPEAEEYAESAESEQQPQYPPQPPPLPHEPLQNMERPTRHDAEALNPGYSNYVYTQPRPEDQPYSEPYADYGVQEHVYEEIPEAPEGDMPQQRCAGLRLLERDSYGQQESVGSRLHHYDERSDGESDSPEKEAEFAPYPRTDSCEQDEDVEHIMDEVKESLGSQSLEHPAAEQGTDRHKDQKQAEEGKLQELVNEGGKGEDGRSSMSSPSEESAQVRSSRQKRDAISLAIKDIKEAIEEVKSRTVRSPYTPDEPKEPIWVMRQDLSPSMESDLQPPLGGDVSKQHDYDQGAFFAFFNEVYLQHDTGRGFMGSHSSINNFLMLYDGEPSWVYCMFVNVVK